MQELIRRRGRAGFVGRREELRLFRANFELQPDDDRHRFLFQAARSACGRTTPGR
ncbi:MULTISPECIES: hypothetical protein [Streptomyces]|uniref:hypothetical protein n=1 Tax=Streptomyces TaxID=1883 RepID=UPI001E4F594F|nr:MULTISPECIES: hypothetical protein [Streptomyces]UFQ20513.1 hypothetical protein J2N69_15400 [Streptomyces huasconensis]WCL90118.1 hypothetical protein PPN52_15410 [Streptomyces sp. JCM 35825]